MTDFRLESFNVIQHIESTKRLTNILKQYRYNSTENVFADEFTRTTLNSIMIDLDNYDVSPKVVTLSSRFQMDIWSGHIRSRKFVEASKPES